MKGKIRAYTLSTCPYCKAFKAFMGEHEIPMEFTDVDLLKGEEQTKAMDEIDRICPGCGYPIIIIDEEIIVGFNENKIREVLRL
ncbi:MAG TPA: glutaredoxin family protein [Euryarchaeota archaeon]|nr:glutaredoxin family protein [Euryarchaeota archaeon]